MKKIQLRSHSLAKNPLKALEFFSKTQRFDVLSNLKEFPSALKSPIDERKLRVACTSNIFDNRTKLVDSCPTADVLIIAGNISKNCTWNDLIEFRRCLDDLPVKHKIFLPGADDLAFNLDRLTIQQANQCQRETIRKQIEQLDLRHISEYFSNLIYLQDMGVEISGVKFFGSPWVSCRKNATFYSSRTKIIDKWNRIPRGIDVLITCQPALGHGDVDYVEEHIGDVDLLGTITCRVGPPYHVFGYTREAYGISFNGHTYFINASMCTRSYTPSNDLILIDIPIPNNYSKNQPNINYFPPLD